MWLHRTRRATPQSAKNGPPRQGREGEDNRRGRCAAVREKKKPPPRPGRVARRNPPEGVAKLARATSPRFTPLLPGGFLRAINAYKGGRIWV
jgi:hypothetical protein